MTTIRRELRLKVKSAIDNYLDSTAGILFSKEDLCDLITDAALEVRGISTVKVPLDWAVAGGLSSEEISRLSAAENAIKESTDEFERAMGYNPLSWGSKDLEPLAKFLAKQTLHDIKRFADWSKREFSPLSPAKARQYPRLVIDLWPQACPPIEVRKPEPPATPEVYLSGEELVRRLKGDLK